MDCFNSAKMKIVANLVIFISDRFGKCFDIIRGSADGDEGVRPAGARVTLPGRPDSIVEITKPSITV